MNQYKVVMEVDPRYTRTSVRWKKCSLSITKAKQSRCRISLNGNGKCPTMVNHPGLSAASTIWFNLPTGR
ncbi:hypothetical protein ACLK1S_12960 [Escherichia coli]